MPDMARSLTFADTLWLNLKDVSDNQIHYTDQSYCNTHMSNKNALFTLFT